MSCDEQESYSRTLSTDALFDVLGNQRRRIMLDLLRSADRPMAVADVTKDIAVCEGGSLDAISADAIERIHLRLFHVHIPKLESVGAITHDADRSTVTLSDGADPVLTYLDCLPEDRDP